MVREQFFLLLLDEEAALAAIPKMLPTSADQRRQGLAAISEVLNASGEISGEVGERSCGSRGCSTSKADVLDRT